MCVYIDVTFKKYNLYVYIFIYTYTYTFLQYTQIYYVNTDFYFGYD